MSNERTQPAWMTNTEEKRKEAAKISMAKDAYHAGCWIYAEYSKKLYTPREFIDSNERINSIEAKRKLANSLLLTPESGYL